MPWQARRRGLLQLPGHDGGLPLQRRRARLHRGLGLYRCLGRRHLPAERCLGSMRQHRGQPLLRAAPELRVARLRLRLRGVWRRRHLCGRWQLQLLRYQQLPRQPARHGLYPVRPAGRLRRRLLHRWTGVRRRRRRRQLLWPVRPHRHLHRLHRRGAHLPDLQLLRRPHFGALHRHVPRCSGPLLTQRCR